MQAFSAATGATLWNTQLPDQWLPVDSKCGRSTLRVPNNKVEGSPL